MKQQKSKKGIRIVRTRTPKGRNVKRYVKQKPDQPICGRCGTKLAGVPRASPSRLKKMARSTRTISRKFGGVLCARCVKDVEKYKARMEDGFAVKRDLTIEKFLPTRWYISLPEKVKALAKVESEAVRANVEIQKIEAEEAPAKPKAAEKKLVVKVEPKQEAEPAEEKPKKPVKSKKKAE